MATLPTNAALVLRRKISLHIEKRKRDAIEGMALYIEDCMNEVVNQMMSKEADIEIVRRRISRATGTLDVLNHLVDEELR